MNTPKERILELLEEALDKAYDLHGDLSEAEYEDAKTFLERLDGEFILTWTCPECHRTDINEDLSECPTCDTANPSFTTIEEHA